MEKAGMLTIALTACLWDMKTGRIPNKLIAAGLTASLCWRVAGAGVWGILFWLGGAAFPLASLGVLFYFRMLGAGDIKLLAVMGGFLGVRGSFRCVAWAIAAGGGLSILLMLGRRNLRSRIRCFLDFCRTVASERIWRGYDQGNLEGGTFHFSIPILISVLLYVGGVY